MKRVLMIILVALGVIGVAKGQSVVEQNVASFVPSERVFVATDRDYYRRGDTIWYRAFLHSEKDEGVSNFVYVDLIDDAQNVVSRHKVKRGADGFYSQIPIESYYRTGGYTLRAYTYWMLNFDKQNYFYKPIFITADHLTATLKEPRADGVGKYVETATDGENLVVNIKVNPKEKGDQYLAVYNANALFVLQPLTKSEELFSLKLADLPRGEIIIATLDAKGRVMDRHHQYLVLPIASAMVDAVQKTDGDSTRITLLINAPAGSYSLGVAHADLVVPYSDLKQIHFCGSTSAIENAMAGKAQNLTHYLELEQALVGVVKNISTKKIAKGFQISALLGGMDEFYTADVDPQTARFQIDIPDVTGARKMMCKLIEPKGTKVLDCVIEVQSSALPVGYSPFRFSPKPKQKPISEPQPTHSAAAPETERVINIDSVVVRGRSGRRPYEPFTIDKGMAQFNLINNYEIYLAPQMDSRTLYEILTINRLLPKYRDRFNPEYNRMGRSGASGGAPFQPISPDEQIGWVKEGGGQDGESAYSMIRANAPVKSGRELLPDDWLWTYVIDGMETMPDEGMFEHLLGEDILTIQLVLRPYFMPSVSTLVVAIETRPTPNGMPRRPSRNFAKLDYVGYTPPVDYKYQTRNTLGWKPNVKVDEKPEVVEFTVPSDVRGNYTITLNGVVSTNEPVAFNANLTL